jgi:hypothetical protein
MDKGLGGDKQMKFVGVGPHLAPEGFAFYGVKIRVDATEITTLDEKVDKNATPVAATDYTWENDDDLLAGEFIQFDHWVTSITLKNSTDSIWAYCVKE